MSEGADDDPLLSAALIVRDEEEHIGECLRSLSGLADEIVVVDTGSADRTVERAEAEGADVSHHRWTADFAAARNASLDRARGRWVLYIDADERVRPADFGPLRDRLRMAPDVSLRVWLHPFVGGTAYREHRLWRNDPRIRFTGVIHEKVTPDIGAVAAADGRPIGDCELTIDHVGYEGDQTAKHRRNRDLLVRQLEAEPGNVFNQHHLARVHEGLGDGAEAETALRRALALIRHRAAPRDFDAVVYADLARLRRGHPEALELTDEALRAHPHDPRLRHARAALELDRDDPAAALEHLDAVLATAPDDLPTDVAYEERLLGAATHAARGLCLLRLGRHREAAEAYGRAVTLEPDHLDHDERRRLCERLAASPPARAP